MTKLTSECLQRNDWPNITSAQSLSITSNSSSYSRSSKLIGIRAVPLVFVVNLWEAIEIFVPFPFIESFSSAANSRSINFLKRQNRLKQEFLTGGKFYLPRGKFSASKSKENFNFQYWKSSSGTLGVNYTFLFRQGVNETKKVKNPWIKTLTLFSINFALTVAGRRQSGAPATSEARNDSESIACLSGSSWLAFAMALKASLFWRQAIR